MENDAPREQEVACPTGERDLDDGELRELRVMLKQNQHAAWLWSNIRVIATWLTGVIIAVTVGFDALKKLVKMLVS